MAIQPIRLGESFLQGRQQRITEDRIRQQMEQDAAREAFDASIRPIRQAEAQYGLRGQILGTVETPEDYRAALGEVSRLNLPTGDLPEDKRSTAWMTFKAPEPAQVAPSWMPAWAKPAPMLPASTALPAGEMSQGQIAPEDISRVQRAAERGLPLVQQEKFRNADIGRQLQLDNLTRNREKDLLSRDWMAFQKDAKIQGMTEAEADRAFRRQMAGLDYALDEKRFNLAEKAAERDAKLGPKFTADQTNAATFGRRLEQALPYLDQAYQGWDPTTVQGATQLAAARQGGVASLASNPAAKSAATAELNILAAILRKESGAAISEGEYASAGKIYFPRYGDTPELRAQKRRTLDVALSGLKTAAGAAWAATPAGEGPSTPQADGIPTVSNQAAYDALPPGAQYKGPDGRILTKKAR